MNSINLQNRMNTIFMNSDNSKTSNPQRPLLYLVSKTNLERTDRCVALSRLSIYYIWKNIKKKPYKNNEFKIHFRQGIKSLNYVMDHILYQISKTILNISKKDMRQ